jgi:hypothetical protein
VGNRVALAGKGQRGYRSHARGATQDHGAQLLRSWGTGWGDWFRGSVGIEDPESQGKVEEVEE